MKGRHTLILLAVLAALAAYAYFFEIKKPEESKTTAETPKLFTYAPEDITALAVADTQGKTAAVQRVAQEDWKVVAPVQDAADSARVTGLVSRLASLTASRVLTEVNNLADYGLVTPALTATLTISDGSKVNLFAGDQTPDKSGYYALRDKGPDVYIIFSSTVEDLQRLISEPPVQPTPTPVVTATPTEKFTVLPTFTPTITPTVEITATATITSTATP
jgi:hypothetical protein